MFKLIETFSGIGSQVQALINANIEHNVEAIVEWEIGAIFAYDLIHNGPQNIAEYRHHTKASLVSELAKYTLSADGSEALSKRAMNSMGARQLKSILYAIERTKNLVDITSVSAENIPDGNILTYSFPCQDLSVSSRWHDNTGGIDRSANNRSTLLWEIERILMEYVECSKPLPKFLLMENVSNILSAKHIVNFNEWQYFLESLGYVNQVYTLDSRSFGIPQSRIRTYMVSVLAEDEQQADEITNYFFLNNLELTYNKVEEVRSLGEFLRLDYSIKKYKDEAIASTPAYTPSREKIYKNNVILATDDQLKSNMYARTITTKQDRHPNSGIVEYKDIVLTEINKQYRNLTPRECFLLMGFTEMQFDNLDRNNFYLNEDRKFLSDSKLIRLAGNSIVVPVLEQIFKQIDEINTQLLNTSNKCLLNT